MTIVNNKTNEIKYLETYECYQPIEALQVQQYVICIAVVPFIRSTKSKSDRSHFYTQTKQRIQQFNPNGFQWTKCFNQL